jgi:hypothetical protein
VLRERERERERVPAAAAQHQKAAVKGHSDRSPRRRRLA